MSRDTQFKNFAKLLLDELCLASDVHIETPFNDDWREEWEETIAQRAYDLATHVVTYLDGDAFWRMGKGHTASQIVENDVPDMTELPQED